jgi:hypothetical protein
MTGGSTSPLLPNVIVVGVRVHVHSWVRMDVQMKS